MNTKRPKIGEMLVNAGVISEAQLQEALTDQENLGGRLATILFEKCHISERQLLETLKTQLGMPAIDLKGVTIPEHAIKMVSYELSTKYGVLAFGTNSGNGRGPVVRLAMSDPTDLAALDDLQRQTNLRFEPALALDSTIRYILNDYFIINNAHGDYVLDEDVATNFCGPETQMVYELDNQHETKSFAPDPFNRGEEYARRDGGEEFARQFRKPEPLNRRGAYPELRALVELLAKKGIITEDEYRMALKKQP